MSPDFSSAGLFERLAPILGLDADRIPDPQQRHEAILVWLFCGVASLTWLAHVPLYGLLLKNIPAMLYCASFGLLTSLAGIFLIRLKMIKTATIVAFFLGSLTLFLVATETGGAWSPVIMWIVTFLLAIFLTRGVITGLIFTSLCIPFCFIFVYFIDDLKTNSWSFSFPIYGDTHRLFLAATYGGLIFVVAYLSYVFENRVSQAFRRSEKARAQAEAARLDADTQRHITEQAKLELEEQIAENRSLLNESEMGFCLIYPDLRIVPSKCSVYFQRLFPEASNFRQVLKALQQEAMLDLIVSVLGEDALTWELNVASFSMEAKIEGLTHELAWRRVTGPHNETLAITFVAKNIQPFLDSKLKEEALSRYANLLVTIVGDREDAMHKDREQKSLRVMKAMKRQLPQIEDAIERAQVSLIDNWQPIFITLHTLKGEMSSFNFHDLKEELHRNEEIIKAVRDLAVGRSEGGHVKVPETLQQDLLLSLRHTRERLQEIRQCCLQIGADQGLVSLSREALIAARSDPMQLQQLINQSLFEDIHQTITYFEPEIYKIAGDLGKPVPRLIVDVPHLFITEFAEEKLKQAFTHVIRNALDHGIETRAEREAKGKYEGPEIVFKARLMAEGVVIRIRDNGHGLNLAKIADKARKQRLLSGQEQPTRQQIAELIFLTGFTTSDSVSLISGRGMGMEAVLKYVGELGGEVSIHLLDESQQPQWELVIALQQQHFPFFGTSVSGLERAS